MAIVMKLEKYEMNPILKANPGNDWESLCVLNPAAWHENGTFYLLYRAAGNDNEHYIHLGLATSTDGFNFKRYSFNLFSSFLAPIIRVSTKVLIF